MKTIEAVNSKTLNHYYNRPDGNLYWFNEEGGYWDLVDGFNEADCLAAMRNNVQFVFVNGPAVSCFRIN